MPGDYREVAGSVPASVIWTRTATKPGLAPILPDACMDLIFDGSRLFIAGVDSRVRWHRSALGTNFTGLRLGAGLGPQLFGVPANELRDRVVGLGSVWPEAKARRLGDLAAIDPVACLRSLLTGCRPDPVGVAIQRLAGSGTPVAGIADSLGYTDRHLRRRTVALFGYGPRHLRRVLRMRQVVEQAPAAASELSRLAADLGYADHAHMTREVRDLTDRTPTQFTNR